MKAKTPLPGFLLIMLFACQNNTKTQVLLTSDPEESYHIAAKKSLEMQYDSAIILLRKALDTHQDHIEMSGAYVSAIIHYSGKPGGSWRLYHQSRFQ